MQILTLGHLSWQHLHCYFPSCWKRCINKYQPAQPRKYNYLANCAHAHCADDAELLGRWPGEEAALPGADRHLRGPPGGGGEGELHHPRPEVITWHSIHTLLANWHWSMWCVSRTQLAYTHSCRTPCWLTLDHMTSITHPTGWLSPDRVMSMIYDLCLWICEIHVSSCLSLDQVTPNPHPMGMTVTWSFDVYRQIG